MARRILVVGGGVVGCSIAWHLAQRELGEVVLLERDRLGSGTTWHSAGNLTWRPGLHHDATVLYAFETLARLTAETEQDTGWLKTGRLFLAHEQPAIRRLETYQDEARRRGIDSRMISGKEAAGLHPLLAGDAITAAWFNPLSGRVNPADLTAAYAKGARRRGVAHRRELPRDRTLRARWTRARRRDRDGSDRSRRRRSGRGAVVARVAGGRRHSSGAMGLRAFLRHRRRDAAAAARDALLRRAGRSLYGREEVGGMMVGAFDEDAKTIDAGSLPEPFAFTLFPPAWDKIAPYFEKAVAIFPCLETAPIRRFVNGPGVVHAGRRAADRAGRRHRRPLSLHGHEFGRRHLFGRRRVTWSPTSSAATSPRFDATAFVPERFGDKARTWRGCGRRYPPSSAAAIGRRTCDPRIERDCRP